MNGLKKAAENGHADAQYELSSMYGRGIYLSEQDPRAYQNAEKSSEWFQKAADNGNGYAEYRIGRMYLSGTRGSDISKNVTLGMSYLEKSALHNNNYAQLKLQNIYKNGQYSVPKDLEKFKIYYKLACATYYVRGCFERRHLGDSCIPQ